MVLLFLTDPRDFLFRSLSLSQHIATTLAVSFFCIIVTSQDWIVIVGASRFSQPVESPTLGYGNKSEHLFPVENDVTAMSSQQDLQLTRFSLFVR